MEYGKVIPVGFVIPSSAFWLTKDLTEKNPFENLTLPAGAFVMDCGAFVGTFASACLEQGASHVVCYEAAPKNAEVLELNANRFYTGKLSIVRAALTHHHEPTAMLSMSSFTGANSITSAAFAKSKRHLVVNALNFRDELIARLPSVLKLDVEGAEYDMLDSLRPGDLDSVKSLFIEFHPTDMRESRILRIEQFLMAEGFVVVNRRKRTFTVVRRVN